MRETIAVQMLYVTVTIFMDHTVALAKKAIMEMAKTAQVRPRLPQFPSFLFLFFGGSALRLLASLNANENQRRTLKGPLIH